MKIINTSHIKLIIAILGILISFKLKATENPDINNNYSYQNAHESCGVSGSEVRKCAPGLVCVDSTSFNGLSVGFDGVCVPNPTSISLCRMFAYIVGKPGEKITGRTLIQKFAIFSFIMLGIAFFLGKVSWGMIMTLIIGLAMVFGAERIFVWTVGSGSSGGWKIESCSDIRTCIAKPENVQDGRMIKSNTREILGALSDVISTPGQKIIHCQDVNNINCVAYECDTVIERTGKALVEYNYQSNAGNAPTTKEVEFTYCERNTEVRSFIFSQDTNNSKARLTSRCAQDPAAIEQQIKAKLNISSGDSYKLISSNPDSSVISKLNTKDTLVNCNIFGFDKSHNYWQCTNPCTNEVILKVVQSSETGITSCKNFFAQNTAAQ